MEDTFKRLVLRWGIPHKAYLDYIGLHHQAVRLDTRTVEDDQDPPLTLLGLLQG